MTSRRDCNVPVATCFMDYNRCVNLSFPIVTCVCELLFHKWALNTLLITSEIYVCSCHFLKGGECWRMK
uniref:Uncharacterized protein n=1 Tax=Arundo donax TaxID=35708 RepID=A0A0A9F822_ARUDO